MVCLGLVDKERWKFAVYVNCCVLTDGLFHCITLRNGGNYNRVKETFFFHFPSSIILLGSMEGGGEGKAAHNRRSVRVVNGVNGDDSDGARQSREITPIKWVTAGYLHPTYVLRCVMLCVLFLFIPRRR